MQRSDALEEAFEEAASSCATRALARVASESYGAFDGGIAVERHAMATRMVKDQSPSTERWHRQSRSVFCALLRAR